MCLLWRITHKMNKARLYVTFVSDSPEFTIMKSTKVIVCVEVSRPSQPNGVMSSAVSLLNHTFTGQA